MATDSLGLIFGCHKHSSLSTAPASKMCLVSKKMVQKWIQYNDKSLSTLTWLGFEMDADANGDGVSLLRYKIYFIQREIRINKKLLFEVLLMLKH